MGKWNPAKPVPRVQEAIPAPAVFAKEAILLQRGEGCLFFVASGRAEDEPKSQTRLGTVYRPRLPVSKLHIV